MRALYSYLTVSFLILFITACAPQPDEVKEVPPAPPVTDEDRLAPKTGELSEVQTEKLKQYIELSETNEGPLRQQYILEMADWLYEQLELDAALQAIDKLKPEHLTQNQIIKSQLLQARIRLSLGQSTEALQSLPVDTYSLNRQQQIEVLDIQAQAFLGSNYPYEAIRTRMKLNPLLQDEIAIIDNQSTIWRILNLMPLNSLKQINTLPDNTSLKGWVELAIVTKSNQNNWQQLEQLYQDWQQRHPNHPAGGTFLSSLARSQTELINNPKHIAVMLPVKGKLGAAGRAIRDGFLSAHYNNIKTERANISVIDLGKDQTSIWQHYQSAVQKGADFIVGPLSKPLIEELSKAKELEVPVLTFNYAEHQTTVTDNLFQFGLLPEDEATQIAELAFRQGKKHAAILVPDNAWGQRIQSAFQLQFEELGGEVRSIKTYQAKRNDFSNSITNLLNLTQSKQRYRQVKRTLGGSIKFDAYRRQDIDMIFIAGLPRAARSILPQLKFHHASDLQVYSTSHAFSGTVNKNADRDINQLIYCEIPWVLESNETKSSIEKNWPDTNKRYTRLYALGADAYHLIPYLGRLKNRSGERFNGYTGNLHLDPLLRVHRELVSAQFIKGKPTPLSIEDLQLTYQPAAIEQAPEIPNNQ